MSNPTWYTPAGSLGIIPESKFYQLTLTGFDANNNNNPVYFLLIAGALPKGMQLRTDGSIEGIPTALVGTSAVSAFQGVPLSVNQDINSKFTVRLYTLDTAGNIDRINDRTFSIIVTGQDIPVFTTDSGSLGSFYDGAPVDLVIGSVDPDPGDIVSYYVSSGSLPPGVELSKNGHLTGYIIPTDALAAAAIVGFSADNAEYAQFPFDYTTRSISKNYQFDIAITDGKETNVRTFTMYVYSRDSISADSMELTADNVFITADQSKYRTPFLLNAEGDIGTYRHSNWFAYKFNGVDLDGDIIKYELSLGNGSTFDSDGVGFDAPTVAFDSSSSELPPGLVLDPLTGWLYGRIPSLQFREKTFKFAITVSKLKELDLNSVSVDWKADVHLATTSDIALYGEQTIDGVPALVGDRILVKDQTNPTTNGIYVVSLTNWIRAIDMDQTLPLNEFTSAGALVKIGNSNAGTRWTQEYTVPILGTSNVKFRKFVGISETVASPQRYFEMTIIGEVEKEIAWLTDTHLGTISNGGTSMFYVRARSHSGAMLRYRLKNSGSKLPQGLTLMPDGTIAGRVTFNILGYDNGNTTFDNDYSTRLSTERTTFDATYTFTVETYDTAGIISTFKEFTISVYKEFNEPYENLYLHAMPGMSDRALLDKIIQNSDIIPTESLYRPLDPNFGRASNVEALFLHGMQPSTLSEYANAMLKNHYRKKLWLGSIKTARALDKNGKVIYEIVYSMIIDDLVNISGNSISDQQRLPFDITTPDGNTHWVYPNSILNMQNQIASILPQTAPSTLPLWMQSKQSSGQVLGFTLAWPIAYTLPGESEKIAYRLRAANSAELNKIYFEVNRVVSDMTLSKNYNKYTNTWNQGTITTFDRIKRPSIMNFVQEVDFATTLPFAVLHNKTPGELFTLGGIDGDITDYTNKTIIFLNQEHYADFNMTRNEGWTRYNDVTGQYEVIPDDGLSGIGITDYRLGVWQFTKVNGVYKLVHIRHLNTYDYVRVVSGKTNSNLEYHIPGATLPGNLYLTWKLVDYTIHKETTFDMGGVQFISPVDTYEPDNTLSRYIPFPKLGILS